VPEMEQRCRRFYDFVTEQTNREPWVSKEVEARWLQQATFNLDIEPYLARSLVLGATAARDGIVASEVERLLDDLVLKSAGSRQRINKADFLHLASLLRTLAQGGLDDDNAEQMVKEAVLRNDIKPRGRGLFRSKRWFRNAGLSETQSVRYDQPASRQA